MKKILCIILLCTLLLCTLSMIGCNPSDNKKILITKDNFEEYFSVSVEFQNVYWSIREYTYILDEYSATADMHIKIVNKKSIEGVTVKLDINLINNGYPSEYWIQGEMETISQTIDISPQGVTDISIPRSTKGLHYRVSPPTEENIEIVIVDVIMQ